MANATAKPTPKPKPKPKPKPTLFDIERQAKKNMEEIKRKHDARITKELKAQAKREHRIINV